MFRAWRFTNFAGARNVALNSAKSDFRCCLPMRCCFSSSVVAVAVVDALGVCSLSNRLSALAGVVLLTALSLLTVEAELIELSDFMIKSGLRVDTLDLVASVNSVDLDADVDGALVVFIGNCVLSETSIDKKIIQVVELGVECGAVNHD